MYKKNRIHRRSGDYAEKITEKTDSSVLSDKLPLCVDLDGTLLKTDTLIESALALIKKQPWRIFSVISWMIKGKANLKQQIAIRTNLRVELLPFHEEFLSFLKTRFQKRQKLILVTAANKRIAYSIADYLGIFSDVFASDERTNFNAEKKLNLLTNSYGNTGFIYAGNSPEDLLVWSKATEVIIVSNRHSLIRKAKKYGKKNLAFSSDPQNLYRTFSRSIRIHQWAKNLLVFVPLITSHNFLDFGSIKNSLVAFLSFCLCASSVYLLNDLLDLENDRCHHSKKFRPLAAGQLSLMTGIILIPVLLIVSFILAYLLNPILFILLLLYFLFTSVYSFFLKGIALIDVLTLALLYTLRIFYGAFAISVGVSQWLLSFSVFLFISLSFIKRSVELSQSPAVQLPSKARGYLQKDLGFLNIFGIASGYISIIIFALYIDSINVKNLYNNPHMLWIICIFLFYWISRIWLKVNRCEMNDDPVLFAIKDKTSYILFFLTLLTILLSM